MTPGAPRPDGDGVRRLLRSPAALVTALVLIDSVHYIFTRLLAPHLPPAAAGFWVMAVSTVEVLALRRGRLPWGALRAHAGFFAAIGLLVAGGTAVGYAAMLRIDPGTAALLSRVSVVYGVALGVLWLGDRLRGPEAAGAALAVAGVLAVSFQPGDYARAGALMVLAGSFLYTLHAALVKRHGSRTAFLDFFLLRLLSTAVFLGLFALLLDGPAGLPWPAPRLWALIAVQATVDTVISRALYYVALRRLDMSVHTLVQTLAPVVTVGWSLLLFGTVPAAREVVGGLAVLAGIALVTGSRAGLGRP